MRAIFPYPFPFCIRGSIGKMIGGIPFFVPNRVCVLKKGKLGV